MFVMKPTWFKTWGLKPKLSLETLFLAEDEVTSCYLYYKAALHACSEWMWLLVADVV